jgi:hypothetical protein
VEQRYKGAKLRSEKIFQQWKKKGLREKKRSELNDLAQYWAKLIAVFGV